MGKKSRIKRERALSNHNHPAFRKHHHKRSWVRYYQGKIYFGASSHARGVFVEQTIYPLMVERRGHSLPHNRKQPLFHGLNEYSKLMAHFGHGTPSLHYAHRLVWIDGVPCGFRSPRTSHSKRALERAVPRGKVINRIMRLERGY